MRCADPTLIQAAVLYSAQRGSPRAASTATTPQRSISHDSFSPADESEAAILLDGVSAAFHDSQRVRAARIALAAEAVHTAMHGEFLALEPMIAGSAARRACRWNLRHRAWHLTLGCIMIFHLLLVLIEPTWAEKPQPPGPFAERAGVALLLEMCAIVAYAAEGVVRAFAFSFAALRKQRHYVVFVCVVLCIAVDAVAYAVHADSSWRVARALRPLLLITRVRWLRRPFFAMARTTVAVADVGLFAGVIVLFYAVWGMQLFSTLQVPEYITAEENARGRHDAARFVAGTFEGLDDVVGNFDNVLEAFIATYTATSTENFPGIYYPALYSRPWAASVFFLSFMTLALVLVVPLTVATVYSKYRQVHAADRVRGRHAEHTALHFAFAVLVRSVSVAASSEPSPRATSARRALSPAICDEQAASGGGQGGGSAAPNVQGAGPGQLEWSTAPLSAKLFDAVLARVVPRYRCVFIYRYILNELC